MADRVRNTWTVTIDRPQEQVFDYLVDLRRHAEWSPKPYRVDEVSSEPVAVGTRFVSYGWIPGDKEHRNECEVTALNRPDSLVIRSTENGGEFVNTFRLVGDGGKTTVEREIDMPKPGGVIGLAFPVIVAAVIRPGVQKGMNMLKEQAEKNAG